MNNVKSNSFFGNSVLVFSSITRFCKFLYANRISHHMYRSFIYVQDLCECVNDYCMQDLNFLYTGYLYTTTVVHEYSDSKTFKLIMKHEALVVVEHCHSSS